MALRNKSRATKKFLIAKFDCTFISTPFVPLNNFPIFFSAAHCFANDPNYTTGIKVLVGINDVRNMAESIRG